ncbi:CoA:oxalate CoA-transferase [Dethiosulfatibacter aminovorans DSM 17477]|uniref:CoA:oxalate CoA-transferase n=1 Tax=Dethiosulfatibacter aminovorans DSM 17477 TaxID=1121476 RepID=A0A1M6LSL8_9FIRM|nr:CaiB/BaiF CoA-transferase family protein [Dethiosulfatibacter aminovorans]SHJ74204.1 CoA:oxalate CoA-transferase [Dethiosulfatibacter aminovorans DSM 17477]
MHLPLENIKVLDLTRVLAGPYCTMVLADLGAEVVKVEMPGKGDDSRAFGPYVGEESAYFMSINRNKKSITLNLKTEEGKNLLKELVKKFDILVENYRPGTMEKLGLGYDVLKEINPNLIYAASSGFGHYGPYSKRPAYDGVVQAMGGIMSITGQKGGEPTRVGPSVGDIFAGMFTAVGILSSINKRNLTGEGMKVDVSMLDCQVAILENAVARYFATGASPAPAGNKHASITPFEPFDTSDGKIMIAVGNDNLWARFCKLIEREDLTSDEKFKTNPLRNEHYDILRPMVAEKIAGKTTEEWYTMLTEGGVPCGPINDIGMVVKDEHVNARNMIQMVEHPVAGELHMPGIPIKISDCSDAIRFAAPVLGQHSVEVLGQYLGYGHEDVEKLKEGGII